MSELPHRRWTAAARRFLRGPVGRTGVTLAVVAAVFLGVLPRIADYGEVWSLLGSLGRGELFAVLALAVIHLVSYEPLWMAAVPDGFAFGVGTTAAMHHSFGFSPATITRAVAVTGIWNNLVKLSLPALALAGLPLVGEETRARCSSSSCSACTASATTEPACTGCTPWPSTPSPGWSPSCRSHQEHSVSRKSATWPG